VDKYKHNGWIGKRNHSNFDSIWGIITLTDILDCRDCASNKAALVKAINGGFKYFLGPKPSKYHNHLYKNRSGIPRCVYAELDYNKERAEKERLRYAGSIDRQVKVMLRAIKWRAKHKQIDYDLDETQILERFRKGTCEKTGLPFEYTITKSAFKPSFDRIDNTKGYTMNNIQVVCLLYNMIKSTFAEADVIKLISHMR
jgi:hypothetical protein